jgi:hypothetical protein
MKSNNLKDLRLLFNCYSPLKTDRQLIEQYNTIFETNFDSSKDIRDTYNKIILKGFLNETVIKASFVEKYSFKQTPSSTITVFELNTGSSRADICILNGKSMVFEIKTEYDSFTRLDGQLNDYKKAYEYLSLVIPKSKLNDAVKVVEDTVGIILYSTLNNKIIFETYREPIYNSFFNPQFQLNQLTKKQLQSITNDNQSSKDEMIQTVTQLYSKDEINRFFIDLMKEKYRDRWVYLYENKNRIKPLDYQWFFKNNISIEAVYS